jgi:BirA family biotin operon repressor/biotin-[acetyl-CoA-carboxylase] ligase
MADGEGRHGPPTAGPAEEATAAGPTFADVQRLAVVDSTNRVLAEAAKQGAPEGLVVVADEQTAGRGRLGRRWSAPAGSALLCSMLFRPWLPSDQLHLLTLAVCLAGRAACNLVAGVEPAVKWPNDLVLGGRKLAGVLAETVPYPSLGVVVGIGVNLSWPPPDHPGAPPDPYGRAGELARVSSKATSLLREAGVVVDRDVLLEALLAEVAGRYREMAGAGGPEVLLAEYRSACSTIGRRVRVELPGGTFEGTALGVGPGGRLLVEEDAGTVREVGAADVVHLRRD